MNYLFSNLHILIIHQLFYFLQISEKHISKEQENQELQKYSEEIESAKTKFEKMCLMLKKEQREYVDTIIDDFVIRMESFSHFIKIENDQDYFNIVLGFVGLKKIAILYKNGIIIFHELF